MIKKVVFWFTCFLLVPVLLNAANVPGKKVLIVADGEYGLNNIPTANARQLSQLLGHFHVSTTIVGSNKYVAGDIEKYDFAFFVGVSNNHQFPSVFAKDAFNTRKTVVWINNGFNEFSKKYGVAGKFGFEVDGMAPEGAFNLVKAQANVFTKGSPVLNNVKITDKAKAEVLATALSSKTKKELPYFVHSGNLYYLADMPFVGANESDRYLYFADILHDVLGEKHAASAQAIIRIEDVTPLHDPVKLREIADILSERGIPFLVGVVPIYVNPEEDRMVTLSERPEIVDALKYMVLNGGSIVMHGVTHQYKGLSTDDCEFWDGVNSRPIPGENVEDFSKKIEMGLDEFFKNSIYPVAWETPHYLGSEIAYQAISKYFSTAVEQRMVINNFDYGQYFPYTIEKDMYGQRIFPENLGYIPLSNIADSSKKYVEHLLQNAASIRKVRDGIASCFFHPFLNLELLKQLADGLKSQGFSFLDLRDQPNWVKTPDKVILTGKQSYSLKLENSYLYETYYDDKGNVQKKLFTDKRLNGDIKKDIELKPGELYKAEGVDYYIKEPTFKEKLFSKMHSMYEDIVGHEDWKVARVGVYWNQYARGASFNDQSSFISMFKSLNINVDTLFLGEDFNENNFNLLVVPGSTVDSLTFFEINRIKKYVKNGGNLITDRKNKLIEEFGVKFYANSHKIHLIRDKYYPQEHISWKYSQLAYKFDYERDDEVFCEDIASGLPLVIGKTFGSGKIMYINTLFDGNSPSGYSNYPFLPEHIRRYFEVGPIVKRENLEFYFDPGLRKNTSIENLVKQWVNQGIRIIHVAGWHHYAKYEYDYKRLISLAHANGLLVYAWIEPPQVSQKFWDDHPQWREKNYQGKELRASWRYPVALTDAACLKAVIEQYTTFLTNYDFDGVNLAELYFESDNGFTNPEKYAPMHPSAINEFKKLNGWDFRDLLKPGSANYWKTNTKAREQANAYRINKITELHRKFLVAFYNLAKSKPGFGVVLTFMDTHFSPEISENHGVSSEAMIALQKEFGFLLQPEDPANKWSTEPARYLEMGKWYASKMSDPSKLMLDLNILNFRNPQEVTPFPTLVQTGIESYLMMNYSALGAPRFTVYCEATCNPPDMNFFAFSASSPVQYTYTESGMDVRSPYSFTLQLPAHYKIISIDGQSVIGYRKNQFIVPAGQHSISFHSKDIPGFTTVELQPQLLSSTSNILDLKYKINKILFSYDSYERTLVSITSRPTALIIDGKPAEIVMYRGNDCFTLSLPAGKHEVIISTGDKFSYGINITSFWSITAIAIYGAFAVILLVIMYLYLKVRRRKLES